MRGSDEQGSLLETQFPRKDMNNQISITQLSQEEHGSSRSSEERHQAQNSRGGAQQASRKRFQEV